MVEGVVVSWAVVCCRCRGGWGGTTQTCPGILGNLGGLEGGGLGRRGSGGAKGCEDIKGRRWRM